ncbi:MAG: hypothetical protein U5L96_15735 [Owenweeksia sp.]|nr:hypothetical protein [Owenweeksia sp.]
MPWWNTAAQWYSRQNHQGRIAYLDPYFAYKVGLNPKNQERVIMLWHLNKEDPTQSLADGDLIMWESHYGPLEGGISESAITQNPQLEILKYLEITGRHARNSEKPYRIYLAKVHK